MKRSFKNKNQISKEENNLVHSNDSVTLANLENLPSPIEGKPDNIKHTPSTV